ncbi:MAG: hypothetical protein ACI8RZ_005543, partial [Myxococcota bacterium]
MATGPLRGPRFTPCRPALSVSGLCCRPRVACCLRPCQRIWRAGSPTRPSAGSPCPHPGGLRLEALRTGSSPPNSVGCTVAATGRLRPPPCLTPMRQLARLEAGCCRRGCGKSAAHPLARPVRPACSPKDTLCQAGAGLQAGLRRRGAVRRRTKSAGGCNRTPTKCGGSPAQARRVSSRSPPGWRARGSRRGPCRRGRTPDSLAAPETASDPRPATQSSHRSRRPKGSAARPAEGPRSDQHPRTETSRASPSSQFSHRPQPTIIQTTNQPIAHSKTTSSPPRTTITSASTPATT